MLSDINKINTNIQITLEYQKEHKINFLDLTIHLKNNKFKYSIHRKLAQTYTITISFKLFLYT